MTTPLALAAHLRTLDDNALITALHGRSIRHSGVSDFFDLAEALLDGDSIQRALIGLDRTRLAALITLGHADSPLTATEVTAALARHPATDALVETEVSAALEALSGLLLAHPRRTAQQTDTQPSSDTVRYDSYDAVTAQLTTWPASGLPSSDELLRTPPPATTASVPDTERHSTDRFAADHAFGAVVAVAELLTELGREGARELQRGGLALPAIKRLSESLAVSATTVPTALSVASHAGLVTLDRGQWLSTATATAWLNASSIDRWRVLAAAWLEALPDALRTLVAQRSRTMWGSNLHEHIAWLYPAAAEEMRRRIDTHLRNAEWLGIATQDTLTPAGTELVTHGTSAAADAMAPAFPDEVRKVYLQHDLTVVSPGPLAPDLEVRLHGMADLENRALASTFRVSPASIDRAITEGETAESMRDFLSSISLTGIPQPLDYLIADAAGRHGRVRVRSADGDKTRSTVRSADAALLTTIAVDHSLSALRLAVADDGMLHSRLSRDLVFWALSDARYPVVAEDQNGQPVTMRRQRHARQPQRQQNSPEQTSCDQDTELVARLRAADAATTEDTGEQWLARQLDHAVRARQSVIVEVTMPDGSVVNFALEPTGVSGGRVRGRDRSADIERTLPLSRVTGIRLA